MGILADIGRSNIGEQAIRLQNQAINIRQLQERKRQQEFENTIAREDLSIKRKAAAQQEEANALKIASAKRQEQKDLEEEARLNKPVNLTPHFALPLIGPLMKKNFETSGWITGNINGEPYTKQRNMEMWYKQVNSENDLGLASLNMARLKYSNSLMDINQKLDASAQGIDAEGKAVKPLKPEEEAMYTKQKGLAEKSLEWIDTSILGLDEKARLEKVKQLGTRESPKDLITRNLLKGGKLSEQEQKTIAGATDKPVSILREERLREYGDRKLDISETQFESKQKYNARKLDIEERYKDGILTAKGKDQELRQATIDLNRELGKERLSLQERTLDIKTKTEKRKAGLMDRKLDIQEQFNKGRLTAKEKDQQLAAIRQEAQESNETLKRRYESERLRIQEDFNTGLLTAREMDRELRIFDQTLREYEIDTRLFLGEEGIRLEEQEREQGQGQPTSEYKDFMTEQLAKGNTREQALQEWDKRQTERTKQKAIVTQEGRLAGQAGIVNEETMEQAYQYYKTTGTFPAPMLRLFRLPGSMMALQNYVSKRSKEESISGVDLAFKQEAYKGLAKEIQTTSRMKALNTRFEKMLTLNAKVLKQQNMANLRTKYPDFNRVIQEIDRRTGDPDIKSFQIQLLGVGLEWAKIRTGSIGVAELSVTAQERVDELLRTSDSWQALDAAIDTILLDAKHTVASFAQQEQEQKRGIYELGQEAPKTKEPVLKKVKIKLGNVEVETYIPADQSSKQGQEAAPQTAEEFDKWLKGE